MKVVAGEKGAKLNWDPSLEGIMCAGIYCMFTDHLTATQT